MDEFKEKEDVDSTYENDDYFDLDKYKKAAQVAYDFSIGKMREAGDQQRTTNAQAQQFSEKDEARDRRQADAAYRF
tara:strand:+ start:156 stop:383 length:228 start_codon:yes stop_codon:yes gene_type:complete